MILLYEWNCWSVEGGKPYPLFIDRARQTSCSLHSIWQSCQAVRIFDFLNSMLSSTKVNKLSRCVAHRLQAEWHQGATYPKPCWSNPCPPSRGWMTTSSSISSPMDPTYPLWVLYLVFTAWKSCLWSTDLALIIFQWFDDLIIFYFMSYENLHIQNLL